MLYHLLFPLAPQFGVLNVTRYITFRTAVASISALAISLLLGPWLIRRLREFQVGQVIHVGKNCTFGLGRYWVSPESVISHQ